MLIDLRCEGFRNLAPVSFRPAPGASLLLGPNGAGKTSLLEAIYLVATSRSFRTAQLGDCCGHEGAGFRLEARVEGAQRGHLVLTWDRATGRGRWLNGKPAPAVEYLAALPVVAWTRVESEALAGPPAARRRLLDQGLVGLRPAALTVLGRYREALASKRAALAAGGAAIDAWDAVLAPAAADIARQRAAYLERLRPAVASASAAAGLVLPAIEISYRPSPAESLAGPEAIGAALAAVRPLERRRRQPLIGPHRDEVEIRLGGHEVRRVASAGERKAIGLLLAAARRSVLVAAGREAVLLLDDADAELDPARLAALLGPLAHGGQLLATSSRPEAWEGAATATRFRMSAGRVWEEAPPTAR